MEIQLSLAGTNINICLSGESARVAHIYRFLFRDFIANTDDADAELVVIPVNNRAGAFPWQGQGSPWRGRGEKQTLGGSFPFEKLNTCLSRLPPGGEDFALGDHTVCTCHLDGLLFFDPDSRCGRLYASSGRNKAFRSLFKLFWIYFAQVLGERGGCFVHATALIRKGAGYLFFGESGAGKTTLAKSARDCRVLSDDGPIVQADNGSLWVYPSPYHQLGGKNGLKKDIVAAKAKIRGMYFLAKDEHTFIKPAPKREALPLLTNLYIHWFSTLTARSRTTLFDLFFKVCENLSIGELHLGKNQQVWEVIPDQMLI